MRDTGRVTTGFKGLDNILDGLRIGDNVVWSVDNLEDYRFFVAPFVRRALEGRKKVVYMRFAGHEPLVEAARNVVIHELDAFRGFESFTARIHNIITAEGRGAFYVFDCLSNLLSAWATDLMIGHFFRVTCPYLFDLDTVAYFALMRGSHSFKTIARIRETTQVLLNVHNSGGEIHIHPVKVWKRHSPTMFLPHLKEGGDFLPVADSYRATSLLADIFRKGSESARRQLDYWDRLFIQAEELAGGPAAADQRRRMVDQLCRVMIGREDRMLALAHEYFTLEDLLEIKSRMIGTGFIGGKAVGMLLARNILLRDKSFDWSRSLEAHDSFYVGSDVYYSYVVHNGWWRLLMRQKTREGYLETAAELREKMQHGTLPGEIREELQKMLEYFGQYPIIVRSSSLLEDSFGNAFAGKYESFFLVNQGSPEQRYQQLEEAVRSIFASTMSEDALAYRLQRGLDRAEEQMALLIQRVSGAYRGHYYFPELAGVGVSCNTFVWHSQMDPRAGMLRMVLGLGTRAVDRVEGDYPRIVALDAPLKRPHKGFEDTRRFSQREVDLLDINKNALQTVPLLDLAGRDLDDLLERYGVRDHETTRKLEARGGPGRQAWILTFDRLLSDSSFPGLMQGMLKTLESAYRYPVDVEFTVNFARDGSAQVNLVQCRPLQTKGQARKVEIPGRLAGSRVFLRAEGNFMGGSISQPITRLISVDPQGYDSLTLSGKYDIARLVGRLNRGIGPRKEPPTMLLGPGRWGTSTPTLGVPVSFAEINNVAVLVEVAFTSGGLMPDLSFGTHFFQDLVETDIFYLALFPEDKKSSFNRKWLEGLPNALEELEPESARYSGVVKVCRLEDAGLRLVADVVSQKVVCFR
ncbi:MAG: PEP/pyruvate-binding domain-containing protein [Candidatus Glassbacteria bacterium]|nr:PEP/pyruvate-binding domain-containing protein [Candidatus Glassbacteria bacterium]